MNKVLFDNQVFSWQKIGGISRYFVELIQDLDDDIEVSLPVIFSDNVYLNNPNNKTLVKIFSNDFFGKNRILKILNYRKVTNSLKRSDFDIFHPTYFDTYFLKNIGNKPFFLTIHDMIPENFPENFENSYTLIANKRELAYKATKIISISYATKAQILRHYEDLDSNKIEVIYHGSNFSISQNIVNINLKLPSNYVLFVGQRQGYKNFDCFLKSFVKVQEEFSDLHLVCTGPVFTDEEKVLFIKNKIENKVLHFFSSDDELKYLYQNAKFFVFPSKEEGFGLPLLEAMALKCPILCSDIPCFREIAENAAIYFDCNSVASMTENMLRVLNNHDILREIVLHGNLRIKDFSWKKSAQQLSDLYKSI